MWAMRHNHHAIVDVLLKHNAEVDLKSTVDSKLDRNYILLVALDTNMCISVWCTICRVDRLR